MATLPRLTGAIRAFTLPTEDESNKVHLEREQLKAKRNARNRKHTSGVSWTLLKRTIEQKAVVDKDMSSKFLHDLKSVAREIGKVSAIKILR